MIINSFYGILRDDPYEMTLLPAPFTPLRLLEHRALRRLTQLRSPKDPESGIDIVQTCAVITNCSQDSVLEQPVLDIHAGFSVIINQSGRGEPPRSKTLILREPLSKKENEAIVHMFMYFPSFISSMIEYLEKVAGLPQRAEMLAGWDYRPLWGSDIQPYEHGPYKLVS